MTVEDSRVDRIVDELLQKPLEKSERIELLRELVQRGEEVPEELLAAALQRLIERLTD